MSFNHISFYFKNKKEIENLAVLTRNEMIRISELKKIKILLPYSFGIGT